MTDIENGAACIQSSDDWIDVHDLLQRCLGNRELADRIVARFRRSLDDTLRQLDSLAEREDWKQFAKQAHRLKGEAGNVGSRPLEELASRVEQICAGGQVEFIRASLRQLSRACRAFQRQEPLPSGDPGGVHHECLPV